jgi:hypothetical protein
MHLIPTRNSRTWGKKISKHVFVHGKENKLQIIMVVSSIVKGILHPFQVVLISSTFKSLPKLNEGCQICKGLEWDLITSHNHWSTI